MSVETPDELRPPQPRAARLVRTPSVAGAGPRRGDEWRAAERDRRRQGAPLVLTA